MTKRIISAIILVLVLSFSLYQNNTKDDNSNSLDAISEDKISRFNYLPTSTTGAIVLHDGYSLSYSEKHEQAEWVAYSLDKKDIVYTHRERPYFIEDLKVKTTSADWRNYKKSGFDRGHLCPAGDRRL